MSAPFTLVAVANDATSFSAVRNEISKILGRCPGGYVELGPGLWVFKNSECALAVHSLVHCLSTANVAFVELPFDSPLPVSASVEHAGKLKNIGVETWQLRKV